MSTDLRCGDCLAVLAAVPDGTVALTVTSPPYDGIRTYGGWSLDLARLGDELYRVTRDGGICAVVIGDSAKHFAKSLTSFRLAVDWCDRVGWRLFETCIYQRPGNPGAWWKQRFRVDHEYIHLFLKGARPRVFQKDDLMVPSKHAGKVYSGTDRLTSGGVKRIAPKAVNLLKCRGTVWPYAASNSEGNRRKRRHPATMPDALARDLIQCFSRPEDLVLDPLMGSGTTLVMAAALGRNTLGVDSNPDYVALAKERLQEEAHAPA